MPGPLVSLVMPVYNPRPEWLAAAVGSALGQHDVDLELIVVDDASVTPVAELLGRYGDDDRLRVERLDVNGGVSRARNAGIAAARGQVLRFVDADDVLPLHSTARLLALMGGGDIIAYGATAFCDARMRTVWTMRSDVQGDATLPCVLGRFHVRHPAMVFPRAVVEAAGEWDAAFRVSGDWDFVLRCLEHAPVRGETEVALRYRRHGGSITADVAAGEAGARRVVERYLARHPELRGTRLERRADAMVAALFARAYLTHGRPRRAGRRLLRALALDPAAVAHELRRSAPVLGSRLRHFARSRLSAR
ncbi:MAG: glycosyltransferase family 2 protein [Solirubrobacteraceae bacterium]